MKKIDFLLLMLFGLFLALPGCEKDPGIPPIEPIVTDYKIYSNRIDALVGEVVTIYWQSNADSVTIFTSQGEITSKNPTNDSLAVIMTEEGHLEVMGEFSWDHENGTTIYRKTSCYIVGHLPIKLSAESTQIPWRTSTIITVESFGGNMLETNLPGVEGALNGTFTTPPLDSAATYYFTLYKNGEKIAENSITINIDPLTIPTPDEQILISEIWGFNRLEFFIDGQWQVAYLPPCKLDNFATFCFLPEKISTWDNGETKCNTTEPQRMSGPYSLVNRVITVGDFDVRDIIILNNDTLCWTYHPGGNPNLLTKETWLSK